MIRAFLLLLALSPAQRVKAAQKQAGELGAAAQSLVERGEACARAGRPLAMEPMRSDLARMEEALERLQKRVDELDAPEETVP